MAKGIAVGDIEHINLTLPEHTQKAMDTFSDELVILGALKIPDPEITIEWEQ